MTTSVRPIGNGVKKKSVLAATTILERASSDGVLLEQMRSLGARSSVVMPLVLNLAQYLTEVIPGKNGCQGTLLEECLHEVARSARTLRQASDREFAITVTRALLYRTPAVLEYVVGRDDANTAVQWDPFEEPLSAWRAREVLFPSALPRVRPADGTHLRVSPSDFRLILLVRFLAQDALPLSAFADELAAMTLRDQ